MTIRIPLPDGNWAEMTGPDELTGLDIDDWQDILIELQAELGISSEPQPDPENPALMKAPAAEADPRRNMAAGRAMRDRMLGLLIKDWSYDKDLLPLPYTAESRKRLPGRVCSALAKAAEPAGEVLNEIEPDPKPETEPSAGGNGSPDTSEAGTPTFLPASVPVPSATVSG